MAHAVAECAGEYGEFGFPEKVLHKIWVRREFRVADACLANGAPVHLRFAGVWNRGPGPDFRGARIRTGDSDVEGDVELHVHASHWRDHRHGSDPAYRRVVLHVVLFPTPLPSVEGWAGVAVPNLVLLPLLLRGLEEYMEDDSIERLARRPSDRVAERLFALGRGAVTQLLAEGARERWAAKVRHAACRLSRLGWEGACHEGLLEVLGYRSNRVAMLRVAVRFPLERWREGRGRTPADAYAALADDWTLSGVRPANHPRVRLEQVGHWYRSRPGWAGVWRSWAAERAERPPHDPAGWVGWRNRTRSRLRAALGATVGPSRFDTLVTDALLPLAAAVDPVWAEAWWQAWAPGDVPSVWLRTLRDLGVIRRPDRPVRQGAVQGLLAVLLAEEGLAPGLSQARALTLNSAKGYL